MSSMGRTRNLVADKQSKPPDSWSDRNLNHRYLIRLRQQAGSGSHPPTCRELWLTRCTRKMHLRDCKEFQHPPLHHSLGKNDVQVVGWVPQVCIASTARLSHSVVLATHGSLGRNSTIHNSRVSCKYQQDQLQSQHLTVMLVLPSAASTPRCRFEPSWLGLMNLWKATAM